MISEHFDAATIALSKELAEICSGKPIPSVINAALTLIQASQPHVNADQAEAIAWVLHAAADHFNKGEPPAGLAVETAVIQ